MTTLSAPAARDELATRPESEAAPTFRFGRAALLSLLLAVCFGLLSPIIDFKWGNTPLGSQHTAPGAIGALLLLVLVVNPLLGLLGKRWKLSRDEMLVVYLSCLFSALVAGIGGHNYWPSQIVGAFYYATPGNKWMDFLHALPTWMTPALDSAGHYRAGLAEGFYSGLSSGQPIPWNFWIVPLGAWISVIFAGLVMTGCLSVMLRAQWCEHEALAFPLLRLPLEMTEDANATQTLFWRNPLMWSGFAIAAIIQLMNGLNLYYPDVPAIPMSLDTGPLFSEAPWNQMGYVMLQVFPLAVGLSFLLTSEISFSLWFFFWFFKLQYILAYIIGYSPNSLPSVMPLNTKVFNGYQEVGAYLAIAALTLWTGREHIRHIVQRALGRAKAREREKSEGLSYPAAFWGLLASFAFLVGWGTLSGAHPLVAMWYWGSYLVVSLVLSRVLADSGLLFVSKIHAPLTVWSQIFGSGPGTMLGGSHSAANAFLASNTGDMRSCLMPSWITGLKLISDRKLPARPLFLLFCAVTLVAITLAAVTHVRLSYEGGALSMAAPYTARNTPQLIATSAALFGRGEPVQGGQVVLWTVVGGLMVLGMAWMRSRFAWFPFHPTGYVMGLSWAMHNLWLSVFIGWAAKTLVMKFGGNESYRKITPLFLGLALGDVVMMLFWLAIDGQQGRTGHVLVP